MRKYNLYYRDKKINPYPIRKKDVNEIMKHEHIGLRLNKGMKPLQINTKELRVVRCIVVDQ